MNITSRKWLSLFLIFAVIMTQSLIPVIVKAKELNPMGFVDSFKIEKQDLYYGERTKIIVNFSEKETYKLQPGDVLTITLPPELKSFNGTIPLDGYGVCEVSLGTAKCTFNENVSTHKNIRGYFTINVQATNAETNQKKRIRTNLGTNLEMQTVTITGPSSAERKGTEPKGPFSYKIGEIQPDKTDEVRWYLTVNYNKEILNKDIKLSDSLQGGQSFNIDSFYIMVDTDGNRPYLTLSEFENKGYGTIQFINEATFKVILNKERASGNRFTITYTANIKEDGKKFQYLKNEYIIEYQVGNGKPILDSQVAQVENITTDGGAEGDRHEKGEEKETQEKWETTEEIEEQPKPEKPKVTEEENHLKEPKTEEKPKVEGKGEEKETQEKWETTEEIEEQPKPEKPKVTEEENHLKEPKTEEKPKVEGKGEEKETQEKWETTEEIEEQPKPEKPKVTEEENHLKEPKTEEKPKVEGKGEEKETQEKWETTEEIEEQPKPEKPKVTEEENHLKEPKTEEKPKVEGKGEEKETQEKWETTEEIEEQPKPEKPKVTEEENHLKEPKTEEKPKVEGKGEEKETQEKWETTEEIEEQPKPEKPKVTEEENHLKEPKTEEKPKVEGKGEEKETQEKWETTEEIEEQPKPEKPKVTEEENHLKEPKTEEKPKVEGKGEEKETQEKWETTEEIEEQPKPEVVKKKLPRTGGYMSYAPYTGGILLVFCLLIRIINKRRHN
ncbi:collagen binding domain-containing protein [Bacillus sp. TH13]|uniref:collagen binding domain-containing protein n=1 Tax=Bacillus sp. TH13 TaxID=2796379 RepID=UPI0019132DE7|nr:collagen binding domain-containing protein [Bacillus sp. TH13]MBK5491810.1 hypothetical protein [Bacillus sp. TH13]